MSGALSLVCQDCNTQLKSVAAAQTHGEVTGHANFAESTEAVLSLVCLECRKPCHSENEKNLHQQRTGHAEFREARDAAAINTRAEMKNLRRDMLADAGIVAPDDKIDADQAEEPLASSSSSASAAAGGGGGSSGGDEDEMVEPPVDEKLLAELEGMGFGRNRAVRAIFSCDGNTADAAINWVMDHENDPDVDEAMRVPKGSTAPTASGSERKALSPEEAKAQAKEMLARARRIKHAEEKKMEVEREKQRIKSGKEMLETKRKLEDMERKRGYELQRREKSEAAKAKAEILAKLEADRRERRITKGLPPDETEEEKAAKLEKETCKRAAIESAAGRIPPRASGLSVSKHYRQLLVQLKQSRRDDPAAVAKAFQTLSVYCNNVLKAPEEEKFRKVNMGNAAFQSRVGCFPAGIEFLESVGFEKDLATNTMYLKVENIDEAAMRLACTEVVSAMNNPFFGTL